MSKGPGRFTRRKAILLGALGLVLAAMTVAVFALWPASESHYLIFLTEAKGEGFPGMGLGDSGSVGTSTESLAPGPIARVMIIALQFPRDNPSRTPDKNGDVTIRELSSRVCWETDRPIYWKKALNLFNGAFGRPFVPASDVDMRTIGRSDKLYVRIAPQGQLYVSTAEDREHMIHAELLDDDPNLAANATKICQDHWKEWIKKVDALAKATAPDKGKR
jgi:hypothetical protein